MWALRIYKINDFISGMWSQTKGDDSSRKEW